MKTTRLSSLLFYSILSGILFITSCSKEHSSATNTTSASTAAIAATEAVSVGIDSSTHDSIYVIGTCSRGHHLDSVLATSLPSVATTYLTTSYSGYTFEKAYADKNASGNITGYVVIIEFNGKPIGLKFDASGNFIKILEQRDGPDLLGQGWHEGGCFSDRDGRHRDTIALSSLPSPVETYYSTNYPGDTLVKAYKNRDSSYAVFSIDNGVYASTFTADGTFVNRVALHDNHADKITVLAESSLRTAISSYLTSIYPGYVFKQAFSYYENGVVAGYIVCIDANGTKYAIQFDASGSYLKSITIR